MNRKLLIASLLCITALAGCKKDKKQEEKKTEVVTPETSIPVPHVDPEPEPEPEPGPGPQREIIPGVFADIGTVRAPNDSLELSRIMGGFNRTALDLASFDYVETSRTWGLDQGLEKENITQRVNHISAYANNVQIYEGGAVTTNRTGTVRAVVNSYDWKHIWFSELVTNEEAGTSMNYFWNIDMDSDDHANEWYYFVDSPEYDLRLDMITDVLQSFPSDTSSYSTFLSGIDEEGCMVGYAYTDKTAYTDVTDVAGLTHVGTSVERAEALLHVSADSRILESYRWAFKAQNYDDDGNVYDEFIAGQSSLTRAMNFDYSGTVDFAEKDRYLAATPKAKGGAVRSADSATMRIYTASFDETTHEITAMTPTSNQTLMGKGVVVQEPEKLSVECFAPIAMDSLFKEETFFEIEWNATSYVYDDEDGDLDLVADGGEFDPAAFQNIEGIEAVTFAPEGEEPKTFLRVTEALLPEGDTFALLNLNFSLVWTPATGEGTEGHATAIIDSVGIERRSVMLP